MFNYAYVQRRIGEDLTVPYQQNAWEPILIRWCATFVSALMGIVAEMVLCHQTQKFGTACAIFLPKDKNRCNEAGPEKMQFVDLDNKEQLLSFRWQSRKTHFICGYAMPSMYASYICKHRPLSMRMLVLSRWHSSYKYRWKPCSAIDKNAWCCEWLGYRKIAQRWLFQARGSFKDFQPLTLNKDLRIEPTGVVVLIGYLVSCFKQMKAHQLRKDGISVSIARLQLYANILRTS